MSCSLTLVIAFVLLTAGAYGLAWTNTEEFCIGCHEMRDNVYAEYKGTIHDKNRSGVRAICANCHVPHEPVALIIRKMQASFEVWGHITGKIDTKEKFQKHRYEMAVKEWTRMKKNGSQECRNCHHFEAMERRSRASERAPGTRRPAPTARPASTATSASRTHEPDGPGPKELKIAK